MRCCSYPYRHMHCSPGRWWCRGPLVWRWRSFRILRLRCCGCDGQRLIPWSPGDRVEVVRGSRPVRLARLRDSLFVDRLVKKFQLPVQGWSGRGKESP